jgi:hypothetical protein
MTPEISADIEDLKSRLVSIEKVLNPEELRRRVEELEQKAADPDLWNDQDYAQHVTSQLSQTQAQLRKMTSLRDRLNDLPDQRVYGLLVPAIRGILQTVYREENGPQYAIPFLPNQFLPPQ